MSAAGSRAAMNALVLAASRRGADDPVAALQGKSHKCLVEIGGEAMIERVVRVLLDSGRFRRILISIESEEVLRGLDTARQWLDEGIVEVIPSAGNMADSVLKLAAHIDGLLPLVVTTADNALHTPALIRDFTAALESSRCDAVAGVTPEQVVLAEFPQGGFGFFRFRDGGYSFCNLYGLRSARALDAARIFRSGGQFRKRPWRILRVFGVANLILYRFRLVTLAGCFRRISRNLGIDIGTVELLYGFAPVDVDDARTLEIAERRLG
ncbi:MAG TPA: nucleotidyltransferase family protein [Arenicellales bacterium]|nr:nucleotidyltransferase family protein [Arenicellales bacterium]